MTLIFAKLTKRRKMALVRLTNREKAMFLNLAFRDELRFTASVIAGDARPSRDGATIGCVPINLNPLNPLNLLNSLNLLNHQDRYLAEM